MSEREDRLPELDIEIQRARAAEAQCRAIQGAQELCGVIAEHASRQAALERYPPDMDKLSGREAEEIDAFQVRLSKIRDDEKLAQSQKAGAEGEINRLGFAGKSLDDAERTQTLLQEKLREIEKLRSELERLRKDETSQRAMQEDAAKELGGNGAPQLDFAALSNAEKLAARLVHLQAAQNELETRIEIAGAAPEAQEIKQHEKAVEALRDWLRSQANPHSGRPSKLGWMASACATLLAVVAGFTFAGGFAAMGGLLGHPLAGVGCLLLSALLLALAGLKFRPAASPKQDLAREQFKATGLTPPAVWRAKEAEEQLRTLEEALGGLLARKKLAEGAETLRIELAKNTEQLKQTENERAQLAEAGGFDPAMPITAYERFIRLAQNWDRERAASRETKQLLAKCKHKLAAEAAALGTLLAPWIGADQTEQIDTDSLKASAAAFGERLGQARNQTEALRGAENRIAHCKQQRKQIEQDIDAVYQRAGLASGDEAALRERLDRLDAWKQTRRALADCDSRATHIRKGLEREAQLCELAEAQNEAELQQLLDAAQSTAAQLEALTKEREQIRADIRHAESGGTIADKLANRIAAETALESKRDEMLDALATNLLLDQVEAAYSADHEPEILREARNLFRQVTAHEFDLELKEDGGFLARDLKQQALRALDELSTGTRMQLLLAVRVAWVARHRSLPLILDEALTTSDEERASELLRCLRALAKASGVQLVYFSARRSEAALWRAALGDDVRVIDLGKARERSASAKPDVFALEPRPPIPEPKGDAEDYAQALGVPAIDPQRDAGEIHLFHLLRDDLGLLHELLQNYRCTSLGQLQSMLADETPLANPANEAWRTRLRLRCKAAKTWLEAWRQGRGKPLGRNELEASGAISETFLNPAGALLASQADAGEAKVFLELLRDGALRGFRASKIAELEDWLRENGFIDDRPPLSADERRARVMRQCEVPGGADAADINQCLDWLEAGLTPARLRGMPPR